MKIYEKIAKIQFFSQFFGPCGCGVLFIRKSAKNAKKKVLGVEKFDDTAENEAFEVP